MSTNKRNARKYYNNKNNKSQKVDKRPDYTDDKEVHDHKKGKNDLSWHAKSETLLREAASIPWSWATGRPIKLGPAYDGVTPSFSYTMPGIMAVRTVMTPGTGIAKSDALNIAAQAIYTDIRRMLKSANQYESSDVMIYLMAVGEIMAYISWLTRLYATTMMYSFRNNYMPDALIWQQGVDPDDLHNHALEFLSRANQLIAKASQIYIPKGLDYLERCRWEYANYYSEGNDIKDQIYFLTPGLFRAFVLNPVDDYKGALRPEMKITYGANLKYGELLTQLEYMIDQLIGDSDFANIAGDLMNRYGESGVMTFSLIPQDAVMSIVTGSAAYEVLEQIQNARALSGVYSAWSAATVHGTTPDMFWVMQGEAENQILTVNTLITQDTSTAPSRMTFASEALDAMLTVHEDPNPAKTMLITRLTNMIYGIEDTVSEVSYRIEAASEFVINFEFTRILPNGDKWCAGLVNAYAGTDPNVDQVLLYTRPFHYAPTFYLHNNVDAITELVGSFDIIAPITAEQIRDINRIDLMSLFAVPDVGKVTG